MAMQESQQRDDQELAQKDRFQKQLAYMRNLQVAHQQERIQQQERARIAHLEQYRNAQAERNAAQKKGNKKKGGGLLSKIPLIGGGGKGKAKEKGKDMAKNMAKKAVKSAVMKNPYVLGACAIIAFIILFIFLIVAILGGGRPGGEHDQYKSPNPNRFGPR